VNTEIVSLRRPTAWSLARHWDVVHVVLGSLYMALLAQVEIPLHPVPITLQPFALFTLALFQGSRKSFFSLTLYLVEGSMGLPVFPAAHADPLWILAPSAGYLVSFPFAAYVAGRLTETSPFSWKRILIGLGAAQWLIYLVGASWLGVIVGWQVAITAGILPFIVFDMVKLLAAGAAKMGVESFKQLCRNDKIKGGNT